MKSWWSIPDRGAGKTRAKPWGAGAVRRLGMGWGHYTAWDKGGGRGPGGSRLHSSSADCDACFVTTCHRTLSHPQYVATSFPLAAVSPGSSGFSAKIIFFLAASCRILVPQSGIKPWPPAVETQSLNQGPPGNSLSENS